MILSIEDIKAFARERLSNGRGSHDWDHTLRVCSMCRHIGQVEGADGDVLEAAALLHDIGRSFQDKSKGLICHAKKGAEISSEVLGGFPISNERKANIIHSIRTHRFRGNHCPETLEAKVLFDADKLDAIGAIGIGRSFQFAGELGAKLHNPHVDPEDTAPYTEDDTGYREFCVKLSKIKSRMLTAEGRRIAEGRHDFMESFFERFLREYEGRV